MDTFLNGNLLTWHTNGPLGLPFTGSAYRAPDGTVVWVDPPDPGADESALLQLGKPTHLLVTFRDHDRAVAPLAKRYGAQVWIPKGTGGEIQPVDVEYDEATALPAGLRAVGLPAVGYGEHALVGEAYGKRFAFIGDAFFNLEGSKVPWLLGKAFFVRHGGPLALKRQYRGGDTKAAPTQLRRLLDERLDMLVLSHGKSVAADADRWLRIALCS
ncbi:MAG TPA: hypothetical protein V6D47_05040 [Oscillatoriaceae cyanobacterium]